MYLGNLLLPASSAVVSSCGLKPRCPDFFTSVQIREHVCFHTKTSATSADQKTAWPAPIHTQAGRKCDNAANFQSPCPDVWPLHETKSLSCHVSSARAAAAYHCSHLGTMHHASSMMGCTGMQRRRDCVSTALRNQSANPKPGPTNVPSQSFGLERCIRPN